MIHFIIPGFYENYPINLKLLLLMKDFPEKFYDNIDIEAIYGVFPFNIFDGGRIFTNYRHATLEEIQKIKHVYNDKLNISLRQVCTNPIVKPENFTNRFANLCLQICENEKNEIISNNSELEEYIRINYPKYSFISSTTKCLNKPEDFLNELHNENYKMVCLDYNLNHNWKMLEQLTPEEKNKCEFLCNAICPPACPERKRHYMYNGLFHLGYGEDYKMSYCGVKDTTVAYQTRQYHNNITPQELYEKYVPMGFSHFKIEGRSLPWIEVVGNYIYYMVKPEYHDEILNSLLQTDNDFQTKMFSINF